MNKGNRKSIRLKGYDYSKEGFYFVTISTYKNQYLFGKIINGEMVLNDVGKIVEKLWMKSEEIRDNVKVHDLVVMPNHLHGVVEIVSSLKDPKKMNAEAYRICPRNEKGIKRMDIIRDMGGKGAYGGMGVCDTPVHVGAYCICPNDSPNCHDDPNNDPNNDSNNDSNKIKLRSPKNTIGSIVRGFKGSVTREIREKYNLPFIKIWHTNYYEYIIRNKYDYKRISKYHKHIKNKLVNPYQIMYKLSLEI